MPSIRRRGETLPDHEALDIVEQPEARVLVTSAVPGTEPPPGELPPDLLNAPVGLDDDLAHALAIRPARRRLPGVTAFLGAAVLVSGGFVGGVLVQKHEGTTSGTGNAALAAAFGRTRTGTTAGAVPGAAGGAAVGEPTAGGSTIGTVKLVDGTTVYVTTTDGSVVKVTTSKATTIKVTKDGAAGDLAPGTTVVVQGTADADGVVTATSVTQAGGGGFGGLGGFGGVGGRNRPATGTGGTGGTGGPAQGAGN